MEKILAIKWRRLGDTILWTSALQALRDRWPSATIDLAIDSPYLRLFEADTRFRRAVALKRESWRATAAEFRREKYDLALNFHASSRSALLTIFSRPHEKIIHHHDRRGKNYFSDRRVFDLGRVMAASERDLNVVRTVGWEGTAPATRIVPSDAMVEFAREELKEKGVAPRDPLILLQPTASRSAKEWGMDRYADLAVKLAAYGRVGFVYDDASFLQRHRYFISRLPEAVLYFYTHDLGNIMGLLPHADVYVGSDSGIKHLAVSLDVPTVTLFGPESVGEWHGYDRTRHIAMQNRVGCRIENAENPEFAWCGETTCPLASHACMRLFLVEDVLTNVVRLI